MTTTTERVTTGPVEPPPAVPPPTAAPPPPKIRFGGIPARVLIMGWLLLLMVVVLFTISVVTRNLQLRQLDSKINGALEQEANEFYEAARGGVDRATGEPYANIEELLWNHMQRQYPDAEEVIVGWVRPAGGVPETLRQQRAERLPLAARDDLLEPILLDPDSSGAIMTEAGEMRWVKTLVTSPSEPATQGIYIVGYFIEAERAEVARTIRTLEFVSLLGLVLAGGAAWLVAGQILAPVRLVRQAAAQITEQDLTRRIPVHGRDDIAALAEQFNAMLDRLEHAFGAQREFLDDASHELRTPITIIRGHLELMGDDPAERASVVRLCTDELDRMARIVDDLLLLAKAERPDFVRPEPVELAELTGDLYAKVRALGPRRWRLEAIGEGVVSVDPQRVTQALAQLAHNAVQHTSEGDEILLGSALLDGRVSFWITDSGPGVPPQQTELIFKRFFRGSGVRGGAGLGLAIVKAIADAHGGTVRLVSSPGRGASFGIDLPAVRP